MTKGAPDMFLATRGLPVLIEFGLLIYCFVDCLQTPAREQRRLPKAAWLVLILLIPLAGSLGWLVAGRPRWEPDPGAPRGPDDDPEFLAGLAREPDDRDDPQPS